MKVVSKNYKKISKNEIMEDLKSMAMATEAQKQHRTALRYLCYHIIGVKNLDKTQKDINIRIGFRDEVFKAGCPLFTWAEISSQSNVPFCEKPLDLRYIPIKCTCLQGDRWCTDFSDLDKFS